MRTQKMMKGGTEEELRKSRGIEEARKEGMIEEELRKSCSDEGRN